MATLKVYRKDTGQAPAKARKADLDVVRKRVNGDAVRVRRPALVDFFVPARAGTLSAFHKLPALSPAVIDYRDARMADHAADGWAIPADSLGRKGTADASTAQSILLWIKKNLPEVVDGYTVSIVVE